MCIVNMYIDVIIECVYEYSKFEIRKEVSGDLTLSEFINQLKKEAWISNKNISLELKENVVLLNKNEKLEKLFKEYQKNNKLYFVLRSNLYTIETFFDYIYNFFSFTKTNIYKKI